MRIEDNRDFENNITLFDIEAGDVFELEGAFFIKTSDRNPAENQTKVLELSSGCIMERFTWTKIIPVNAHLVIEN